MNSFNDPNAWVITAEDRTKYDSQFYSLNPVAGFLSGEQAKFFFLKSGLSNQILGMIWHLSDVNMDGKMDKSEFLIAMQLIKRCLKGLDLPFSLPPSLLSSLHLPSGLQLPSGMMLPNQLSSSSPPLSNLPPYNTMPSHSNTNSQVAKHNAYSTMSRSSISSDWVISPAQRLKYKQVFDSQDSTHRGYLTGLEAKVVLTQSGLTHTVLAKIWCLADIDADGNLSSDEFCVAMHLIDQAKSGFSLPATLPADLIPPSQRKLRRASEVTSAAVNVAIADVSSVANSNNKGIHANSGIITPGLDSNAGVNTADSPAELEATKIVTFEDKRKENFKQGQAELEKRRTMLRELQIKESEARYAAERVQHEKQDKIRMEQEMRKQQEFERQMERQRHAEEEKEEVRRSLLEQKEAARQQLNRQRQAEWQKQRQEQLLAERSKCQAAVDQLKQQTGQQRLSLETLREKKHDTHTKAEDMRKGLDDMASTIDSTKLLSLSKTTEIDVIASELEEVEMKTVAVEQESLRLKRQMDSSENTMDDSWRELKKEKDRKEEAMAEKRKKLEIVGESCAKKEEVIRKMEEEVKNKEMSSFSVMKQKKTFENLFDNNFECTPSQVPWQPTINNATKHWQDLGANTASSLQDDSWASISANQDQKTSWTADFNSNFAETSGVKSSLKRYKALYNFSARTHDELSLVEGDVVRVDSNGQATSEPGWMIGSKDGQLGCFPEAYVAYVDEVAAEATSASGDIKTKVKDDDKNVFSTLSKAFEEAFSGKKSPERDTFSSHPDDSSTQPFQALNDAFSSAFGAENGKMAVDKTPNFDSDFSSLNFDKPSFETSTFETSNIEESSFDSTLNPTTNITATTISFEGANLTTMPLTSSATMHSTIDNAIKDILERSRKTPVSPIPFATPARIKSHSPSPLITTLTSPTILTTNDIFDSTLPTTSTSDTTTSTTDVTTSTTTSTTDTTETTTTSIMAANESNDEATDVRISNNKDDQTYPTITTTTTTTAVTRLVDPQQLLAADPQQLDVAVPQQFVPAVPQQFVPANPQLLLAAVRVQAVYAWQAKKPNHLSFGKGDVINKLSEQNTWCFGEFNGERGWFPKSYVKDIGTSDSPFPDLPPEVKPDNFEANSNGNHNNHNSPPTSFDNQSPFSNAHQSFIAKDTNKDAHVVANNKDNNAIEEFIVVAMFNYQSDVKGDLTFKKGDVFVAQASNADWWAGSTDDGRSGIFPSSYVRKVETMNEPLKAEGLTLTTSGKLSEKKPEIATAIADYEATGPEQLSVKVGQLVDVRKKSKSGWWEGEIQVKGQKRRVGWFPANYVKLLGDDSNEVIPATPDAATKPGRNQLVALYTYAGQTGGDLSFIEGERITLTQKCSDDWWEGELNGRVGIFPANYVAMVTEDGETKI